MKSCVNCKFSLRYVNGKNETSYYECRFNPPQVHIAKIENKSYLIDIQTWYPRVTENDWCYQFKKAISK